MSSSGPQPSAEERRSPGEFRGAQNERQRANNEARRAAVGMRENLRHVETPVPHPFAASSQPSREETRSPGEFRGAQNERQRANNEARRAAVGMRENMRPSGSGGRRRTRKAHRKSHKKGRKGTRRH